MLTGTYGLYCTTNVYSSVLWEERVFRFRFPDCKTSSFSVLSCRAFVVFGDHLGASMRRGRAPADNSEILAMFSLQYSGARATQTLADDAS